MSEDLCCSCQSGTCENSACVKTCKGCTNCLLTRGGFCKISHGSALEEKKSENLICPFGIPRWRFHSVDEIRSDDFALPEQWLLDNDSRPCPVCGISFVCWGTVMVARIEFLPQRQY